MNQDPIDSLQSFYDSCHSAPLPESLIARPTAKWVRFAVPGLGIGFGALLALLVVFSPQQPSQREDDQLALTLTRNRLAATAPAASPNHAKARSNGLWND